MKGDSKDDANGAAARLRCGSCIGCFRTTNCEKCANCTSGRGLCLRRTCVQAAALAERAANGDAKHNGKAIDGRKRGRKKEKADLKGTTKKGRGRGRPREGDYVGPGRPRKNHKPVKAAVVSPKELKVIKARKVDETPRQCYGPSCTKAARPKSKYCGDDCGLKMADDRLRRLLPERVRDYYNTQPLAERADDKRIRELTVKKALAEGELEQANQFALTLDLYISTLCKLDPVHSQHHPTSASTAILTSFCIVCAEEFPLLSIAQHVNECYVQQEQKCSFGSHLPATDNPHDLICDEFDPQTNTYCKRLRFACPEHYSDNLGSQMKCCGYPLKWTNAKSLRIAELFASLDKMTAGEVCTKNRWFCKDHMLWEQNIRALLDSHRMRLVLYLDDISDSYHRVAEAYRTRGDALTLLTNWRIPAAEVRAKEDAQRREMLKRKPHPASGVVPPKSEEPTVESLYKTIISLSRASRFAQTNVTHEALSSAGFDPSILAANAVPGELLPACIDGHLVGISPLADGSSRVLNNGDQQLVVEDVLEHFNPTALKIE